MSYRVRTIIQVIDEDGDVVNFQGRSSYTMNVGFKPLQTALDFGPNYDINVAQDNLNKIYKILDAIKELS